MRSAWLLACALLVGCSGGKPASLSGMVSFDGEPVAEGAMRFFPTGETLGEGAGATISGGEYQIKKGEGLVAGEYLVSITATRSTGGVIHIAELERAPGEGATAEEVIQFLPEKYNLRSTLHVTIEPGANKEAFELVP